MKKLKVLGLLLFLLFSIYLYLYLRPRDYKVEYKILNYNITEKYYKQFETYYFILNKGDKTYSFNDDLKYNANHQLIEDITENDKCIEVRYAKKYERVLCYDGEQISNNNNISDVDKETIYDNNMVKIYDYNNSNIAIWNYRGFELFSKNKVEKEELFSEDIYDTKLIYQVDNNLYIPNYNKDYYFDEIYIFDIQNNNHKLVKLDYEISYDSLVLGYYQNKIYILDIKERKEYAYSMDDDKLEIIGNDTKQGIYYDGKEHSISITKLINKNDVFKNIYFNDFVKKNNTVYMTYYDNKETVKLFESEDVKILSKYEKGFTYLIKDNLYYYDVDKGCILLANYFEWNFNSDNKVFITNN